MIRDANRLHGTHGTLMCVSQDASSYLATLDDDVIDCSC